MNFEFFNDKKLWIATGVGTVGTIAAALLYLRKTQRAQIQKEYAKLKKDPELDNLDKPITQAHAWRASAPGKIDLFGERTPVLRVGAAIDLRTTVTLYEYPPSEEDHDNYLQLSFTVGSTQEDPTIVRWNKKEVRAMFKVAKKLQLSWRNSKAYARRQLVEYLNQSQLVQSRAKSLTIVRSFLFLTMIILSRLKGRLQVNVVTQIPPGYLLGSSSAFLASLATVLLLREKAYICNPDSGGDRCDLCREMNFFCPLMRNFINSWVYQAEILLNKRFSGVDNSLSVYGSGEYFVKSPQALNFDAKTLIP